MARLVFEENKDLSRNCQVRFNGDVGYKILDGQELEDHVIHWYRKDTLLKAYNYFIQPIPNVKMWLHISNIVIEPPEPKPMSDIPRRCRKNAKDEPKKKYEKLPNNEAGMGRPGSSSQPPSSS
ncbi:hypothetical protein HAX54_009272 [Datura stramonium]|uniref:Uncharacterized protein n=1 Tax=Datura stramonium TaxID=4076 RepID=A0ABS8RWQ2_DATST|nr:hypothetical protein [Datura stramonium]